jgi:hypothetical protein
MNQDQLITSLGYPIIQENNLYKINLTELKIFTGLSVLAKILSDQILEQVEGNLGDISFLYKINPNINPELLEMQIYGIQVYAKAGVLDELILHKDEFHTEIRTIFGTFQRPTWAKLIHPEFYGEKPVGEEQNSLVFYFDYTFSKYFILERAENSRFPNKFFLRLIISSIAPTGNQNKYHLVNDIHSRTYLAGSTKLSEFIAEKILQSVQKNLQSYIEEYNPLSSLFEQIQKTSLNKLEQIGFFWDREFSEKIELLSKFEQQLIYKKIFLLLEDDLICSLLKKGKDILLTINQIEIYINTSRREKVLNFSFNNKRQILGLRNYLDRMPELKKISEQDKNLNEIKIFLVHHITSEILAYIQALKNLNSYSIKMLFVKYSGKIPDSYLDSLHTIQDENFFMAGLTRHSTEEGKEYFTLAKYYSDITEYTFLQEKLYEEKLNFFEAMKLICFYFFLLELNEASKQNKKILLIEDGGYLAPYLNELIFQNPPLKEIFAENSIEIHDSIKDLEFKTVLEKYLIGTIEHTRNGYDRLLRVKENYKSLQTISYSIAISKQKIIEESKEVAHSILSAIESILHGQGLVLSTKKIIVLGAKGNIGSFLVKYLLGGRLHEDNKQILQIDLKFAPSDKEGYSYLSDIPDEEFLNSELFIGVIGESILKKEYILKLILEGKKDKLFFASGSTKTVEFSDLSKFLFELAKEQNDKNNQDKLNLEFSKIIDPQSLMIQGTKVEISSKKIKKTIYLLGDLTPINFLYYGVPTETMDKILSMLLSLSIGLVHQYRNNSLPDKDLYAVDEQIDRWGIKL